MCQRSPGSKHDLQYLWIKGSLRICGARVRCLFSAGFIWFFVNGYKEWLQKEIGAKYGDFLWVPCVKAL